jgi:glucose 1-dehydrogenase
MRAAWPDRAADGGLRMALNGKVALVTGGDTGIGKGICQRLARDGADVVIDYRGDPAPADELAKEIQALGRRGLAIAADISDPQQVNGLFEQAVAQMGRLDILVNNAGIEKRAPLLDVTVEDFDRVISVNLRGVFLCTQAAVRQMAAQKSGRIINISSVHEDLAFPEFVAYAASKGGVRMLMRTLAVELAPLGITVNDVAPGAIATPINTATLNDPAKVRALEEIIPLGRIGTPDDVAAVVAFLATDDAAYVTGSTYYVDGGLIRMAKSL